MKNQVKEKEIAETGEKKKLTEMVISVLDRDERVLEKVVLLNELVEKKERLRKDLKYLIGKKKWLKAMLVRINKNFGEIDTIKDTERLEEYEIKQIATVKAIRLVQQRLEDTSPLSKDIRDCRAELNDVIDRALWPVAEQWQKEIDEKVNVLLQRFNVYSTALSRVSREQTFVDKNHLNGRSISNARPNLSCVDKLMANFRGGLPYAGSF